MRSRLGSSKLLGCTYCLPRISYIYIIRIQVNEVIQRPFESFMDPYNDLFENPNSIEKMV